MGAGGRKRERAWGRWQRGLSLLELVVAVAVFAIVAVMAQAGLRAVIADAAGQREASARQRQLDLLVLTLERELGQVLARPVQGPYGDDRPALLGRADAVEYSTLAFVGGARLLPARHRLLLEGDRLLLVRQARLDAGPGTPQQPELLLEGVQTLAFDYIDSQGRSQNRWPPLRGERDPALLPRAVSLRLQFESFGELERVIELPENPP